MDIVSHKKIILLNFDLQLLGKKTFGIKKSEKDVPSDSCHPFKYGGCGGNHNNFENKVI